MINLEAALNHLDIELEKVEAEPISSDASNWGFCLGTTPNFKFSYTGMS